MRLRAAFTSSDLEVDATPMCTRTRSPPPWSWQNLCVDDAGNTFLLSVLNGLAELVRGLGVECLHAEAFTDLAEVGVAVIAVQLAGGLVAVTHFGCQRANAVAHLQVVDAAERAVVEYNNGDLRVLLHCGRDLGVEHHERAITNECINFLVRLGQFGAECTCDLVAHAGCAVFHVVGVGRVRYPQTLEVCRQRACCCNHDCVVVCLLAENADRVGLSDGAADLGTKSFMIFSVQLGTQGTNLPSPKPSPLY